DDTLPRLRSEELDAVVDAELARALLERRTIWAFARDHEADSLGARDCLERPPERLLRGQPAGERERVSVSGCLRKLPEHRHRVRQRPPRGRGTPRAEGEPPQVRARAVDVGRTAQLEAASTPKRKPECPAATRLELVDVAGHEPAPARALEGGIRGQLHDVRS